MHNSFDVLIIGGGAAGMMAAISCKKSNPTYSIALIDRTFALGRKILVCGAGRCNVTNLNLNTSVENRYYGADKSFVKSILTQFGYENIVNFFNDLGIDLYIERKTTVGKLFPITDQAKTVTSLLEDELKRLGVEVFLNTDCKNIQVPNDKFKTFQITAQPLENNEPKGNEIKFISKYLIVSAGGKTYPALGANGSGYNLAESLGHTLVTPVPSALPLETNDKLCRELQGIKLDIEVTSVIDGKLIKTSTDDVMFTSYGISGPAVLNISREVSIHINREQKNNAKVCLNFFPGKSKDVIKSLLKERWRKRPNQTLEMSLCGIFPNKFPPVFLNTININHKKLVSTLNEQEINKICEKLNSYEVIITATRGWNEAEFTAGGINSEEVKEETLESKKIKNLYFCGEILDVDGDVGGFNLSWAWSSGFVAGMLR